MNRDTSLNTLVGSRIATFEKDSCIQESNDIFFEEPVTLDEFLYGQLYLNLPPLSQEQYNFVEHGSQIYYDKELEYLRWTKVRRVSELVAYWGKGCFSGDTKVSLLSGEEVSLEQLEREYKDKEFWVYSCTNDGHIVAGKAHSPRITKYVKELIEITLDNGKSLKCTPEHLFMLRNGSYKEARYLTIDDSLMPLYRNRKHMHEHVYSPYDNHWTITHRLMYDGDIEKGNVIHHKDGNKFNNVPHNLEKLSGKEEHFSLHNKIRNTSEHGKLAIEAKIRKLGANKEFRDAYCLKLKDSMNKPEVLRKISDGVKEAHSDPEFKKSFKLKMKEVCSQDDYKLNMSIVKKKWYEERKDDQQFLEWKKQRSLKCNSEEANRKRQATLQRKREQKLLNHKITSIRYINLDEPIAVYDITVEKYHNFALSSGIFVHNSGKGFISSIIFSRIAYLLLCLTSPHKYFNLAHSTAIDMLNMAYSGDQALQVFFKTFSEMVKLCKWFKNYADIKSSMIQFDKRIAAYSGNSFEEAFEGKNLIVAVLDEIAAFKTKAEVEQMSIRRLRAPRYSAESVFDMAKSSVESRFPNIGKVISLSFPRFKGDYIQQLYEVGKDEPTSYVSFGATWIINPTKKKEDFDVEFRKNPERANIRYACNPQMAEGGYFKNREALAKAFPILNEEKVPSDNSTWFPMLKPWLQCAHGCKCAVHVDLGLKRDKAGICVAHVSDIITTQRRKDDQSEAIEVDLPIVTIDLVTSFIAPPDGEIDFALIRQLIMDLMNRGFSIGKLTCDSWQSADFLQIMAKMGIETDTLSVDRNTDCYDAMKELVYDSRLRGYSYLRTIQMASGKCITVNELMDELVNLIEIRGKKIDHPSHNSKDVSDAVAGAVCGAIELGLFKVRMEDFSLGKTRETYVEVEDREFLNTVMDDYFTG